MPTRTQQSDILEAAYASHGDTKHILLLPSTPRECFDLTADAFDLAEQLQTPVIVLTDLDLGMNDHISAPFHWDDSRKFRRGKVLTAEGLEEIQRFGRYLDTDGDGIPYRTYPGTHPTKGSFFTRGTSRDEYANYTEDGAAYKRNMDRLALKWETARSLVPAPERYQDKNEFPDGVVFFGTTRFAAEEAIFLLRQEGIFLDALRIISFPFTREVAEFMTAHERIFVIEQNRDAQMRSLFMIELGIPPARMVSVLNYDGLPITADYIVRQIKAGSGQKQTTRPEEAAL